MSTCHYEIPPELSDPWEDALCADTNNELFALLFRVAKLRSLNLLAAESWQADLRGIIARNPALEEHREGVFAFLLARHRIAAGGEA
jgi:hypothetical protein